MAFNINNNLPALIVFKILSYLEKNDLLNASSTCKSWRNCIYNRNLWPFKRITLNLVDLNLNSYSKRRYLENFLSKCSHLLIDIEIKFDPTRQCTQVAEILLLIGRTNCYNNRRDLKKLALKPTTKYGGDIKPIMQAIELLICGKYISHLSFGLLEQINFKIPNLLKSMAVNGYSHCLESLHLNTIKENPDFYPKNYFSPCLLSPFDSLHTFSVDYDQLSDGMVSTLSTKSLHHLIINIHKLDKHSFRISKSNCRMLNACCEYVTLNLLHTNNCVLLHEIIRYLKITTFRAFFVHDSLVELINLLTLNHHSLRSLVLIDNLKFNLPNRAFSKTRVNALVMLSWRCKQLSSLTIIGFEISDCDLIAIIRLRGTELKELNIPFCCISLIQAFNINDEGFADNERLYLDRVPLQKNKHIINHIGKPLSWKWKPMELKDIPKSVIDRTISSEDAYLRILLNDQ